MSGWRWLRLIPAALAVGLTIGIPLAFQACGSSIHSESSMAREISQSLSEQSRALRQAKCASCHDGSTASHDPNQIMNDQALIDSRVVIPGDPLASPLYQQVVSGAMPKSLPRLADDEVDLLARWIVSLKETTQPPAVLSIANGSIFDFGPVTTGAAAEYTFTLTNSGEGTATGIQLGEALSSPFSFKDGVFAGTGGTCLSVLAGKSTCTLVVRFAPTTAGQVLGRLKLNYTDGSGTAKTVQQDLAGTGQGLPIAQLVFALTSNLDFGAVVINQTRDLSLQLRNYGAAPASAIAAQFTGPFSFAGGSFPGAGGTCGTVVLPKSDCTLIVRFSPKANGDALGNLMIQYNGGQGIIASMVPMKGTGSGGQTIYFSEIRQILTSSCQTCHSNQAQPERSWGYTYASLLAFKYPSTQSTPAIEPRNLQSRFALRIIGASLGRQMGVGSYGSLSLVDRQKILDWIAIGAPDDLPSPPASLTIDGGPTFDFGTVTNGTSVDRTFTLTNSGGKIAQLITGAPLNEPYSFKDGAFPGAGGTCASSLGKSTSCNIVVRFSPTVSGVKTAQLRVDYHDGEQQKSVLRPMTGQGTGVQVAILQVSGSGSLGIVPKGQVPETTLTVRNTGQLAATQLQGTALSEPFRYSGSVGFPGSGGTCSAQLAGGASCTIRVQFAPKDSGSFSSALNLNYKSASTAKSVSFALSATATGGGATVYFSDVREILQRSGCNTCHSSDWGSTYASLLAFKKSGATPAIVPGRLNSRFILAITGNSLGFQMGVGDKGALSAADRQSLIDWIFQNAPNDPPGNITQSFRPLLGDRYYMTSVLNKVFGDDPVHVGRWVDKITLRADLFGSDCVDQDQIYVSPTTGNRIKNVPLAIDRCNVANSSAARLFAETSPVASTVGESVRQSACLHLINDPTNTLSALSRSGLSPASPFDMVSVNQAFASFYPGQTLDSGRAAALINIGTEALNNPNIVLTSGQTRAFEGWRFIYLTLCLSSGWQAP